MTSAVTKHKLKEQVKERFQFNIADSGFRKKANVHHLLLLSWMYTRKDDFKDLILNCIGAYLLKKLLHDQTISDVVIQNHILVKTQKASSF